MDFDQNRAGPRKGSVAVEKIGGPPEFRALCAKWGFAILSTVAYGMAVVSNMKNGRGIIL